MIDKLLPYNYILAQPYWLLLLVLVPLYIFIIWKKKNKSESYWQYANLPGHLFEKTPTRIRRRWLLHLLRSLAFVGIIIALARPQKTDTTQNIDTEGIDIVLTIDISGSMLAEDFQPNRLEATKKISEQFIKSRRGDRIGLVIFSGESFTQCPITLDTRIILEQLQQIESGMLLDGTAIGNGLATAIDRLRTAKGKSKVVILMTDGVNMSLGGTTIDPLTALEIAKAYDVKVYTIGVGTKGQAIQPVQDEYGNVVKKLVEVEIDEELLQKIADETGGLYYRATDNVSLQSIYDKIDTLEKSKVEISSFKQYEDKFYYFLIPALLLLALEILLKYTYFKTLTEE